MKKLLGYAFSPLREGDIALYRGASNGLAPTLLAAAGFSEKTRSRRLQSDKDRRLQRVDTANLASIRLGFPCGQGTTIEAKVRTNGVLLLGTKRVAMFAYLLNSRNSGKFVDDRGR